MNAEQVGNPLDGSERQISLATLQIADVVRMKPQQVAERLLGITTKLAVAPQVPADHPLQFAFHRAMTIAALNS